jgi:hypothetical protein
MGFSLSTLTAYVEEQKIPLTVRTLFGSQTGKIFTKQTGIKTISAINYLSTTAQFQTAGCTWNASGTTSITHRLITVGNIQVMESLCIKDLNTYYTQTMLKVGNNNNDLPFEQKYAELKADVIAQQLEVAYWQGDTTSWNANLKQFDGFNKIIAAASATTINGNPTGITVATGITSANVVGIINGIVTLIPAQVYRTDDKAIYCGTDVWRLYQTALVTANLYNYAGEMNIASTGAMEVYVPSTNIKVIGLDGLTGTSRLHAGRMSNFYIGTDMENEEEQFKMWESQDNGDYRFKADFKAGVQVAKPEEIVTFKLS